MHSLTAWAILASKISCETKFCAFCKQSTGKNCCRLPQYFLNPKNPPVASPVATCYTCIVSTTPIRVEADLFEAARSIGAIASRSAAQQFNHWARIGRELELSPRTSTRDIQRVLAAELPYDDLSEFDQAIVRTEWDEQLVQRRANLNYADTFTDAGRSWTEADALGNPITRNSAESHT